MQYEEELKFSKFTEQNESLRNLPQDCSKCHIYSSDSNSKQKIKRKIKNRIIIFFVIIAIMQKENLNMNSIAMIADVIFAKNVRV